MDCIRFGWVSDIEHGDFRLFETQAILRHLCAVFPFLAPFAARLARMNERPGMQRSQRPEALQTS